jgi:glycosyltransferase involved in cell wall biosynthesis
MPAIALVSREVFPFGGGGIGVHVTSLASVLADHADVTVFTSAHHRERYEELRSAGDPRLPAGVEFEFVDEPNPLDFGTYYTYMQSWSSRVYDALCRIYGAAGGPDLVEFPDYLGEGLVTAQARDTLDPRLRNTRVCIRTHTSVEMTSVLDGLVDDSFNTRIVFDSERYALRRADTLVWPGGDVLGMYERFYGRPALAASRARIPAAFLPDQLGGDAEPPPSDGPVRFIYFGRLERRKGVQNLVRAAAGLGSDDWELTIVGADTDTAPLGVSMKLQLELMADGDERIRFVDGVDRHDLPALIASHHAAVLPSLWECWPNVALETLAAGRPVLATPTGGYVEMIKRGESGWLTDDCSAVALRHKLRDVLEARDELDELIASGRPREQFARLADEEPIRESYLDLVRANTPRPSVRSSPSPLVSVVLTYFKLESYVEDAIRSVFEQTYRPLELIVVNDGAMREADLILAELATRYPIVLLTQPNSGLGAARNFGISQTRGEFVVPLDADNVLEPDFIARGVELLRARPDLAYVTSWSRYIGPDGTPIEPADTGYQPLGNWSDMIHRDNVAGDATAVIRRRVFDLGYWYSQDMTSYEDWLLYRELHVAGIEGAVMPERLFKYRVREGSMIREVGLQKQGRLADEMRAQVRERQVRWESRSV